MKLTDIKERLSAVEVEMRGIYDGAEEAGEDLTGEKLERWNTLKTERDELRTKEERATTRDELDRKAEAKPIEKRGTKDGETVFGLTPEQRMADYVHRTTGVDCDGLSVGRAVVGMMTGNWKEAEGERRVMGTTTGATGGFLMPDPISANLIDLARNATTLIPAGALTIPMASKNLSIVKVATDPTAYWRAEGATITESDGTFEGIDLVAHSMAALVRVNAELMDDVPSFAATLDGMLAGALGLKLDAAGFYGTGAGQPLGRSTYPACCAATRHSAGRRTKSRSATAS